MGRYCAVYGCYSDSAKPIAREKGFFSIPAVIKHHNDIRTEELSKNRRFMWIASINRKYWKPTRYSVVCSDHFISGQPARLYDTSNPDWVPTLNMGKQVKNKYAKNSEFKKQRYPNRHSTRGKRPITVVVKDKNSTSNSSNIISDSNNIISDSNSILSDSNFISDTSSHSLEWLSCISPPVNDIDLPPGISIQTTLTMSVIEGLEKKVAMLEAENKALREELYKSQITADEGQPVENIFYPRLYS